MTKSEYKQLKRKNRYRLKRETKSYLEEFLECPFLFYYHDWWFSDLDFYTNYIERGS